MSGKGYEFGIIDSMLFLLLCLSSCNSCNYLDDINIKLDKLIKIQESKK